MRAGDGEGLDNPQAKSFLLQLAHPRCDVYGTGRERAGPLRLHHLHVVADDAKANLQELELIALRLKNTPRFGEIPGKSDSGALGLKLLSLCGIKLSLEGADPLLRLVTLPHGLVTLPVDRTALQPKPLRGLALLVSLPA